MKLEEEWAPSKFTYRDGELVASRDAREVGVASRLVTDIVAQWYGENLCRYASGKLLDLGCGKAPLYEAYRDFVEDTTCVDWGNSPHESKHLDYECDLTKPLPFSDGEFQTLILSDVLEHIPEPELLWNEMRRILSHDGVLLMNVPFYYWLHEQPHDYYRYTEYALRRFVDRSGMELLELQPIGGVPEILADLIAKNLAGARPRKLTVPVARFVQWLASRFVKTRVGSKYSEFSARKFPLGYFLVARK